jgi:hypothetical protein
MELKLIAEPAFGLGCKEKNREDKTKRLLAKSFGGSHPWR